MTRLKQLADRLAAQLYRAACLAGQLPAVLRDRTPVISADEVLAPATGETYAIVVKYGGFGATPDFLDLLDALRRQGVNAVVICNGPLTPADEAALQSAAHRLLRRPNTGRDFGAYRAATLHLLTQGLSCRRMIYLNDSVLYTRGPALDALVAALAAPGEAAVGAFENREVIHHLSSHALSVPGAVFARPEFREFWQRYRPFDIRTHAIRWGEQELTQRLIGWGCALEAVYTVEGLAHRLDALDWDALAALVADLPRGPGRDAAAAAVQAGPQAGDDARSALAALLIAAVSTGSPSHAGFGLFRRVLGCPLVKRDVARRFGFYEAEDVAHILDDLPTAERDRMLGILLPSPDAPPSGPFQRMLVRHGLA